MKDNKRVAILVTIALILAITAISLNAMDSNQIPTTRAPSLGGNNGGNLGIEIQPGIIEDKLTEGNPEQ